MDRLFDSFLREPLAAMDWPFKERAWAPSVDVAETDREVIVRAEVPGIDPKDLDVTISGNQLILSGEKKEAVDTPPERIFMSARAAMAASAARSRSPRRWMPRMWRPTVFTA